ncbi:MAG TPA: hypothetical protein VM737_09215 [Gemmatimonadota bacterium]|nr:hypothetical protein [Gemmatimonadota bacterium]
MADFVIRTARLARSLVAFAALALPVGGCGGTQAGDMAEPESLPEARLGFALAGHFAPPPGGGFWEPADIVVREGTGPSGVWIVDRKAGCVYRYDLAGNYRGRISRPGGGPGELKDPLALGIVGDTLWVFNAGNHRIEYLTVDGTPLGAQPLPEDAGAVLDLIDVGDDFVASTVFGPAPLVRFARGSGRVPAHGFGEALASFEQRYRARKNGGPEGTAAAGPAAAIPSLYRLAAVGEKIWVLHLYLPIIGIFESDGELTKIVTYPSDPVEVGGEKVQEIDGVRRRVREAPPEPGGAIGLLEGSRGDLLLLTHQAAGGHQRLYRLSAAGEVLARVASPLDGWMAVAAGRGSRRYVLAAWGALEEPAAIRLVAE